MQTGIQRAVRNILRNAGEVAGGTGFRVIPVVHVGGQFRAADLRQVLHDKLQTPLVPPPPTLAKRPRLSPRQMVVSVLRPGYRGVRRALASVLPFPAAQRFLFAHPINFGLAWLVLQPWRQTRRLIWALRPDWAVPTTANPQALDDGFGVSLDSMADHLGNRLLLLDASWSIPLWRSVERFQAAGGTTKGVIYDLVPITHADTSVRSLRDEYSLWVREHLRLSGTFLTISRTVADQLRTYLAELTRTHPAPHGWSVTPFYLGSELDFVDPTHVPRPDVQAMFAGSEHVFIVVGSIEPRKNHGFILDAFERLWAQGSDARLVIIGRYGWKNEDVVARIEGHAQLGRRMFLVRDMADSELDYAYRQASALVIASESEGFGLPVVEAFQRGLPVICSDIEVFREIADGRATFFDLASPGNLADAVANFTTAHDPAARHVRLPQHWLTWRESTEQLLAIVLA